MKFWLSLVSVRETQQLPELARCAARLLLRALDARETGAPPPAAGPHRMPAALRIAGSTGPPPGGRP